MGTYRRVCEDTQAAIMAYVNCPPLMPIPEIAAKCEVSEAWVEGKFSQNRKNETWDFEDCCVFIDGLNIPIAVEVKHREGQGRPADRNRARAGL